MTSVFRLHPAELQKKMVYLNYLKKDKNFDFLNIFLEKYNLDINVYYKIISGIEEFKLKNVLKFFNSRLFKINGKIIYEDNITYKEFNELVKEYINNDITRCIVVMNLIQHYIYPMK